MNTTPDDCYQSNQWVSANDAKKLVLSRFDNATDASNFIVSRAFIGTVRSKAAYILVSDKAHDSTDLPQLFWQNKMIGGGYDSTPALSQNWEAGDFTAIAMIGKFGLLETWKAFGVEFLRNDVAALNRDYSVAEVEQPRIAHESVVTWCRNWILEKKGNGMDKAWDAFKEEPAHSGLSRDDSFRPAWKEAKTKQNIQ